MKKPNFKYDLPSYSKDFLESLNPKSRMDMIKSSLGYSDYSPFRNEPFIDIKTPTGMIDMSNTGIPLYANGRLLAPYSGLHNMGTTNVREVPANIEVPRRREVPKRNIENFTVKFPMSENPSNRKLSISGNINPSINFGSPYLLDLYGRLRGEYNLNKNLNIFGEATTSTRNGVNINPATITGGLNFNFQDGGQNYPRHFQGGGGTYGLADEGDVITLDEGSNNPGMDFMRKWTNSPMHYQILSKEDPDNVNFLTNARLSNLENVNTYYHSVPDVDKPTRGGFSYTYYPEVHMFPGSEGTRTEEHEYSHQSDNPMDLKTAYSNFGVSDWFNYALNNDPLSAAANTLYKFYTKDDEGFIPGDPSKYSTDGGRLIPQSSLDLTEDLRFNEDLEGNWYDSRAKEYEEEAKGYEEGSEEYEAAMNKAEGKSEWADYVTEPTEVRARLNVIRSGASNLGIYDPFNEPINEDQFKDLLENQEKLIDGDQGFNPLNQLRDIYTDDEIFKMLNTISYNTDETPGSQSIGSDEIMARYGGSLPKAQDGDGIDFNSLQKGIKWVESLNGKLMKNKQSSASGYYGQLFDEIEYDGTRDEFIADTDFQNELFRKRAHGEIEDVPGLINNGIDLLEEYKDVDHGLTALEIAGLSNMLGRQGTREYLGNVIRDGQTLAEVFPDLYGNDVNQANKTPQEYIQKFNEGIIKREGGEFLNKIKRLNQQLQIYNSGGRISPLAKKELIDLEMIKPKMQGGGSNTAVQQSSYVTKRGDNLSRIAANNNMTLSELLQFNPRYASNPSAIGVGDVVQLSDAPVHNNATSNMIYEVESGDSLSKIASRYGVRYQDIAALNNISNPKLIKPGQKLTLPDNAVATGPNVAQQQNRANSVYIPSQSNILVNSNTGANEVWAKRKKDAQTGEWTTTGKSALIDEINKDTQANRIVRGMNDIAQSETIDYTIQSGDMLGKIARENGISVEKLMEDNNITDPRRIQPGLKIEINKSTGKPYIIVDEKAGRMHMYYPGNSEPTKSYPIVSGLTEGDQQTKTVIHFFKDGKKLEQEELQPLMDEYGFDEVGQITSLPGYTSETQWDLGNKSSGAGVYTIDAVNEETKYMGNSSSFVLANQAGNRPGTVIHSTPSASMTGRLTALDEKMSGDEARALGIGTNGCINGTCSAMTELYENPDIGKGTQIFILPEDEGNNFVYENGKINFYTKQANDEAAKKYMAVGPDGKPGTADDVEMDNSLGLNETPGNQQGNYKPINITFDKNYYQKNSNRYDGLAEGEEKEFNDATKPFLNSLTDNKKKLMDKLGMDGDTYNDLAMIAFGIYGYESGMGDTNSEAENLVKGGTKAIPFLRNLLDQNTNPDVKSKQAYQDVANFFSGDDGQWDSTGYTQAKWHYIEKNPEAKAMLAKLGINKDNYTEWTMDPAKSAEFTIARLYDFHQKTQASINSRNEHRRNGTFVEGDDFAFDPVEKYGKEEEVYDPWTQLPNQWSPTSPGYADFVNQYTDFITLTETDIDDVDNNLIIKGEYTDDDKESRKKIQQNKGWDEKLLNLPETIEFARLDARDAIDDVTGGAASYIGEVYDDTVDAVDEAWEGTKDAVSNVANDISEWWDEVDLNPLWKLGGEFGVRNQVQFYDDYISGMYTNTRQENKAKKIYDKLNRMYYNDSKKSGKSQIDVMRSILHSNR
jgi:LysM repeat protein